MIDFSPGQPSADLIPVAQLERASADFFNSVKPLELNYGEKPGDHRFRQLLADFLSTHYAHAITADELFLTGGNSQGLNMVCEQFSRPGDTVLVEDPSFFLAFGVFRDHGLRIVPVSREDSGFCLNALEHAVQKHHPSLVYTIPSFHNPTGRHLSLEKREQLVAMSERYGFTVVADEVYQLLGCGSAPPPALGCWATRGRVISLGSFSKILTPGIRLGWLQAGPEVINKLTDSGMIRSGGNVSHFTSHIVRHFLGSGAQAEYLRHLQKVYGERIEVMDAALKEGLGTLGQWHKPEGGYFFWLELADGLDARKIQRDAAALGTGFIPGVKFSRSGRYENCLRLSFAPFGPNKIRQGIARLSEAIRNH